MSVRLAALALALAAGIAGAQEPGATSLQVTDAWARPQQDTTRPSAAYFTLHNSGRQAVVLVRFSSDAARRTEVHESREENGMMRMVRQDSLVVPAGGDVVLRSGGLHVMLMRLRRPLVAGDTIEVVLAPASGAGGVTVRAPVRAP